MHSSYNINVKVIHMIIKYKKFSAKISSIRSSMQYLGRESNNSLYKQHGVTSV